MCIVARNSGIAFAAIFITSAQYSVVNAIVMHVSCHVHVCHHSLPPLVDSAPHPFMQHTMVSIAIA